MPEIVLKEARTGQDVPVVDGVYLHSIYGPVKEAQAFVLNNLGLIADKKQFIILGLGFGYHIDQLIRYLVEAKIDYQIIVLETNKELIQLFNQKRPFLNNKTVIKYLNDPEVVYSEQAFLNYLYDKPCILVHDVSFNLSLEIYKKFLTFQHAKEIRHYFTHIHPELRSCFSKIDDDSTLDQYLGSIARLKTINNKNDLMFMAYQALIQSSQEIKNESSHTGI